MLQLVVLLCLAAPSTASAQFVTSTGVTCGDEVVSFDTLNMPTEGANAARLKEMDKLYTYALAAWSVCGGSTAYSAAVAAAATPPYPVAAVAIVAAAPNACGGKGLGECVVDEYPGCSFVATWLETRTLLKRWPRTYAMRGPLRALDAELPAQAMRVLAHKTCDDAKAHLPRACVELAVAEASAKGVELCKASDPQFESARKLVAPDVVFAALDDLETSNKTCERDARACQPDEQRKAATFARIIATAKTLAFYEINQPGCPSKTNYANQVTDAIGRRVEDVKFDRPVLTSIPRPPAPQCGMPIPAWIAPAANPKLAVYNAVKEEFDAVRSDNRAFDECEEPISTACRNSTYYVGPSGALTHQDFKSSRGLPTLCIDSSSFAIDRPFEVVISAYPTGPEPPTRIPTLTRAVWPGEQAELDLDQMFENYRMSIVRVTVRGYPRGVSLRALAQRGQDGPRLLTSYESSDLRAEARKVAEARAPLAAEWSEISALDALVTALTTDPAYISAVKAMNDSAVDASATPSDAKKLEDANTKINLAIDAISKFLEQYGKRPENVDKLEVWDAVIQAKKQMPPAVILADTKTVPLMKTAQLKVVGYKPTLDTVVATKRASLSSATTDRDALDHKLTRLCRISKELIPMVDEDVLTAESGPGTYVLDYDYEAGFQRAPARSLKETDRVYVRVRRVQPGGSVAIAIGNKGVVQHAISLVGFTPATPGAVANPAVVPQALAGTADPFPALSSGQRSRFNDLDPDQVIVQASSTQILVLPGLEGATRYELTLCALGDKTQSCPPPTADGGKARIIARNLVVVHSERRLGVRAGLGFTGTFGPVRTLVDKQESTKLKYVRETNVTPDFAVPLLLTYYAIPRDAVDFPRGFSLGFGAGLDMVKTFQAKPKMYGSLVLDWSGFGLTGGFLVEGRDSVDVAAGRYVTDASTTMRFYPGAFLGLTTDLDIFEAVFSKYINGTKDLPTVGAGGKL
jgi:hypothetical protein